MIKALLDYYHHRHGADRDGRGGGVSPQARRGLMYFVRAHDQMRIGAQS
jgi:hypothetical protein